MQSPNLDKLKKKSFQYIDGYLFSDDSGFCSEHSWPDAAKLPHTAGPSIHSTKSSGLIKSA